MRIGNYGRGLAAIGTATLLGSFVACGQVDEGGAPVGPEFGGDADIWDADFSGLTQLATACDYDTVATLATATIVMVDGETAVLSKRVADSALLVNGTPCTGALGTATTASVKKIAISGSAGDEVVILDFINGTFGAGSATAAAVVVDMSAGGTDALKIRGTTGADTVSVGASGINWGVDTSKDLTYTGTPALTLSLGAGTDAYLGTGVNGTGTVYTGAITVYGGDAVDTLTGGDGVDTFYGGAGNDILAGGAGADVLNGDGDNDTFNEGAASNGGDTFNGGTGTDTVNYGSRTVAVTVTIGAGSNDGEAGENDTVAGDIEVLTGGSGNDTFTGSAANETFNGGLGNDTITDGDGDDTVNGDAGDDTFLSGTADNGSDAFNGGAGTDTLSYTSRTVTVTADLDGTADDGETGELDNAKADVENLVGGSGNDSLTGSASNNVLTGGDGDDTLNGLAGDDTFAEGAADNGSDTFNGGVGTDTVDYSSRVAVLTVTMDGAAADDGLAGEADDVNADCENLKVGTGATNSVTGNDSDNYLYGNTGDDTFNGGLGNDTLAGAAGDDVLNGDAGDDLVDGEGGDDDVDCGAGEGDIYITDAADTTSAAVNCEL